MIARRPELLLLPAAPLLALLLWWCQHDGGYAPRDWLPGGLLIAGLLAVTVLGLGASARVPSKAVLVALGAFAAYTVWSFLSITWANDPGRALQGSERTLVYLLAFTLVCLLPWTTRTATWALLAWIAGITVLGGVALADAITGDPTPSFAGDRFADPLAYYNADAALWSMAALPAVVLASRRETPPALRPALLGAATFLFGLALVIQSRGWALGMAATLLVAVALVPGRLRLLAALAAVAVVLAPAAGTLLDPYNLAAGLTEREAAPVLAETMDDAARALGLSTLGAIVVGLLLTALDVRTVPTPRLERAARTGGRALAAVAAVAALGAVMVATDGDPVGAADDALAEFRSGQETAAPGTAGRFASFGSTRYDLYRVSVEVWRDHPVAGAGQDNFLNEYLELRDNDYEEARWTHSLPLRLLTHTGLVGLLLFGAVLVAAAVPILRTRGPARAAAAAAALPAVLWVTQGLVDWLWEYPVLTVAAFALLGAGMVLGSEGDPAPPTGLASRIVRAGAVAAALVAAVLLVPAWIADRDVARASQSWTADPQAAYRRLERARDLAPLDVRPPIVEGVIARRAGDLDRAREAFLEAVRRDPRNWYPQFELALLATAQGDRKAAASRLGAARNRNPKEPLVLEAAERLRSDDPLTFEQVDERARRTP